MDYFIKGPEPLCPNAGLTRGKWHHTQTQTRIPSLLDCLGKASAMCYEGN